MQNLKEKPHFPFPHTMLLELETKNNVGVISYFKPLNLTDGRALLDILYFAFILFKIVLIVTKT